MPNTPEYQRAYYHKNKEKICADRRAYHEKNREKILPRMRRYRQKAQQQLAAARQIRFIQLCAWLENLKTRPCVDCGGSFRPVCMDFDHVHGRKRFTIATARRKMYSRERIMEEVAKCDLVCANCHRVRTERRQHEREAGA